MITEQQKQELDGIPSLQNPGAMKAEMERCKDARYFYNAYYKKESDPEFSEEAWALELARMEIWRKRRFARNPELYKYPYTPEDFVK